MPAINPNNYNIDNFNSQNLGPITVTDFRDYILRHNLPDVDPVLQENGINDFGLGIYAPQLFNPTNTVNDLPNLTEVSFIPSPTNENTSPRPDNKKRNIWTNEKPFYGSPTEEETFDVTTKSLEDPGSIDSWLEEGGFATDVFTIRNFNNLTNNEYGPEFVTAYNDPNQPLEDTGYIQYPTSSGSDILGPIIARSLGFSSESFIDFPSDLEDISIERRATELSNRIALNFIDDTIGALNLDPLGLLAGQSLFMPNYTITTRKGIIGKTAQFLANLTGFNYPRSIIPGGDEVLLGSNAFQEDLIDYTGRAQKKLLYKNVYSSKYSPELLTRGWDEESGGKDTILSKIGDVFSPKKKANNYLKLDKVQPGSEPQTFFGKLGQAISDAIVPGDDSLIPLVDKQTNPNDPMAVMGTKGQYPAIESLDENSSFTNPELENPPYLIPGASETDYYPNKTTLKPSLNDPDNNPIEEAAHTKPSTKNLFYWQNRQKSIAKRGLLDFTQKMVNNAEVNGHTGGAKFIGRFDSDSNLIQATRDISDGKQKSVPKHKVTSKGNLTRGGEENDHYCRSWSTRNPYQNHYDLIRRDKLYRAGGKIRPDDIASGPFFGPYQSTLEDTGHVKISPNNSDDYLKGGSDLIVDYTNKGNDVKRYMFSIENLAWTDAPQRIGLEACEMGPNGGRIMWFPPYDISFTDNTTANWNTEVFIGRAEPIYTYNHTERKGTLSWSIITDHPSVLNEIKFKAEEELYKFFAGCGLDVSEFFEPDILTEILPVIIEEVQEEITPKKEGKPKPVVTPKPIPPDPKEPPVTELSFYFRNATSDGKCKGRKCSKTVGRTIQQEIDIKYDTGVENNISKTKDGDYLFLNKEWLENIDALIDFLATPDGQRYCVEFNGYCSAASTDTYNQMLSIDRADRVYKDVVAKIKAKGEAGPPPPITPPDMSASTSGTTYYVYEENNFKRADFGYKCIDSKEDKRTSSRKATDTKLGMNSTKCSDCFSVGRAYGYYPYVNFKKIDAPADDTELSAKGRWIVSANSEDYAQDKDEDGDPLESENDDGTVTSVGVRSRTAKEERVVKLRVFKNNEYINNTETAKNNPDKIGNMLDLPIDKLELLPITQIDTPEPVLAGAEITIPMVGIGGDFKGVQQITLDENGVPEFIAPKPLTSKEIEFNLAMAKTLTTADNKADVVENNDIVTGDGGETGENVTDPEVLEKIVKRAVQKLFKECSYFEKIEKEDPFLYEAITEKIKHFHPAFHSITPEGLNSRLTFLQQCLRQGPSLREGDNQTQNMAFGKPPVLVLRVGDFYYTKIIPDSLNVNYEPLVWDMNPEGVGVQPMIAKVDLNFSIIGGSSLDGPIRQLQNAVSFNFFANTSVYNPRRYWNKEKKDGSWQSLEERLEGEAERIITGKDLIGFGAFKSGSDADKEYFKPSPESDLVETTADNEQDFGIIPKIGTPGETPPIPASWVEGTPPPIILQDSSGNTITAGQSIGVSAELSAALEPGANQGQEIVGIGTEQSVFYGGGGLISSEDQTMIKDMYPGATTPEDDIVIYIKYTTSDTTLSDYIPLFTEVQKITKYQEIGITTYKSTIKVTEKAIEEGYTLSLNNDDWGVFYPNTDIRTEVTANGYYRCKKQATDNPGGPLEVYYSTTQNKCLEYEMDIADWVYDKYFKERRRENGTWKIKIDLKLERPGPPLFSSNNIEEPSLEQIDIPYEVSYDLFDPTYEVDDFGGIPIT